MQNAAPLLIYLAVLARAAGWSQDHPPIPLPAWILLGAYGAFLLCQPALTRRWPRSSKGYTLVQAGLVVAMLYLAPTLDIFSLLFLPLSYQVVHLFKGFPGFAWIGLFTLAMAGTLLIGMEWEPGLLMILGGTGGNLLMGSYAHLRRQTEQAQRENRRLLGELQMTYRSLKESAAEQERLAAAQESRRLVRELHDSLTQTLFSMNLAVQAARLSVDKDVPSVTESLTRLRLLSRSAAEEVRLLLGRIPPQPVAAGELAAALRQLVEERRALDGMSATLEVRGMEALPGPIAANLFRIAQEALNNASRHAGRCRVVVRLDLADRRRWMEVEDSGCGFDADAQNSAHQFGLTGMAERAKEIGWEFQIDSAPGRGTRIRVQEGDR